MDHNLEQLKIYKAKLDFICQNYDPFNSKPSEEVEDLISELELNSLLEDPFQFTNQLLQLLDKTQNQIQELYQ